MVTPYSNLLFYITSAYAAASKRHAAYRYQSMATPPVLHGQDVGTVDFQPVTASCSNIYLQFDALSTVTHAFSNENSI